MVVGGGLAWDALVGAVGLLVHQRRIPARGLHVKVAGGEGGVEGASGEVGSDVGKVEEVGKTGTARERERSRAWTRLVGGGVRRGWPEREVGNLAVIFEMPSVSPLRAVLRAVCACAPLVSCCSCYHVFGSRTSCGILCLFLDEEGRRAAVSLRVGEPST